MDYYKIGQNIRKFRKARGYSQEQLAESLEISVTHMSHIETGNTKLSLPVLVKAAQVLQVQTDDLLCTAPHDRTAAQNEIAELLERCDARQVRILGEILRAAKAALDMYE